MKTIVRTRSFLWLLLAGAWLGTGCASRTPIGMGEPNAPCPPVQMVCEDGVTTAEVIHAAEDVLTRMHFAIEKLDVDQGIIRTRPLPGAQFFELWRSDNASTYAWEEANVESIRRTVELRVRKEAGDRRPEGDPKRDELRLGTQTGGADSPPPTASGLCVECTVAVERLSLPANEAAGTSHAYRVRASNTAALQQIRVSPQQRRGMTWIDLGQDPDLAARILSRVEQRLQRAN